MLYAGLGCAGMVALLLVTPLGPALFAQNGFLPHGYCFTWAPSLLTLHLAADLLIAAAYFSIPLSLAYLVNRREDLPFNWVFLLFAAFIVACGLTHLVGVLTLWYPFYWFAGAVKAVTALVSIAAAVAVVYLMPRLLALPSASQLRAANARLENEVAERRRKDSELQLIKQDLEQRVAARTAELAATNSLLGQQREWLHTILTSICDAVIATDASGRVVFLNPVAEQLTGWRDADAQGQPLERIWQVRGDEQLRAAPLVAEVLRRGQLVRGGPLNLEFGGEGAQRYLEVTAAPIAPAGDAARGVVLVVRDLTAQRAAERSSVELSSSLASTNALLDTLFEQAPIGMGFWDRDLRYVRVNGTLARMNGLPVEAHLGRTIHEVLPNLEARVQAAFRTVLETGQPLSDLELQGETPAAPGVVRYWRTSVYPVRVANALVGVGAVCDEITELKQAEAQRDQLLQAESEARARAEEMSRLKDDFISTLSHEMRNPLNSIVGWTHLLESGKLSEADREKAVERIARNVKAQARLVDELLDFSRLSSGKLQLNLERLNASELAQTACETFRAAARAKGIELECRVDLPDLTVSADAQRLQQILSNLISNAVKFTPEGGSVLAHVRRNGPMIEFEVRDNGSGIDAEFLPYVFDPFRQAPGRARQPLQGVGIGLTIVKRLVELHGGRVTARSDGPGRGASFLVELPVDAGGRNGG
jgi:PAS domain S-box-containing protein